MNEYVIGSIAVAFILGLVIGQTWGKAKGFAQANFAMQQQMEKAAMLAQFNSMFKKEEEDETSEKE
jgi:hypothetical protein